MDGGGRRQSRVPQVVTHCSLAALTVSGILYTAYYGIIEDEGWYLQAALAVWDGELPYRDFAFTQAPLAPYVFGLPQALLGPSLLVGRCTALLLWLATCFGGVRVVQRVAGPRAAAGCALVLAAQPALAAAFVTIKTYALLAALFVAVVATLLSSVRSSVRLPLAVLLAGLTVLTRISAVPFWAVVAILALVRARTVGQRVAVAAAAVAGVLPLAALYTADPPGWRFGLWRYHQLTATGSTVDRVQDIVLDRIPGLAHFNAVYVLVLLGLVLGTASLPEGRAWIRSQTDAVVVGAGLAGFVAANLLAGEWHFDYALPALPAALVVATIVARPLFDDVDPGVRPVLGTLLGVACFTLLVSTRWLPDLDWRDGGPFGRMGDVAAFVRERTEPGDEVLALTAQAVQVESGRDPIDGVSLAQFSYVDVSDSDAELLDVVNFERLRRSLDEGVPAMVVLTEFDVAAFSRAGLLSDRPADQGALLDTLERNYDEVARFPDFAKPGFTAIVYDRVDGGEDAEPEGA